MGAQENECHPCYSFMSKLNFYGSIAFLSFLFIPFLIQTPPLRMADGGWGGGGGGDPTNFSKVPTCKERALRISFFKGPQQKFEDSVSSHPSGGGCPVWIKYRPSPGSWNQLFELRLALNPG